MGRTHRAFDELHRGHLAGITPTSGETVAVAGASAQSSQLTGGIYRLSSSTDCWYLVGNLASVAAVGAANNVFLGAGQIDFIEILDTDAAAADAEQYVSVIQDTGAGNLSITRR